MAVSLPPLKYFFYCKFPLIILNKSAYTGWMGAEFGTMNPVTLVII